ncbi:hypothetical protein TrCOL_g13568 [Triparma columacea]|uniref:Uncharacterized protein n=1 Tax=Triparma columacea TaxID=722753 RepID=A0A9W7FWY2_9STRA|nr:hypothetical protein TrCOL_g13568 [Triparma columacea]
MSKPSKKQKVAEQVVYGVVWEVDVSIENFGEGYFDDNYGDEIEAADEEARETHERKCKDQSPDVYASKASALKFAEKKFVELCGWYLPPEELEEEEDDDKGKNPYDNPSLFKSGDGFSWNGEWIERSYRHQIRGEISVRLKPMKLLA